ncbi:unnamed protein product [Acanthoscelides obtectus]|uniref:PiggyBac transposable element-derived protein domain-containing protein n=1 Tax=Acanthoscelides obtectus TaxID=200917 RepID=A0A9P0PHX5_ACAOB|nr:unnamed protein product [Acanthoscelides obtectus]CAK1681065.1 PiggyBac transposable element-derived protein 3 [Acanthoscelides obtectus]
MAFVGSSKYPLDFQLVDMTVEELYHEIEMIDKVPSDQESIISEESDNENDFCEIQPNDIMISTDDDSSDDDVPLSRYLQKPYNQPPKVSWSSQNLHLINPAQPFTENQGLCLQLLQKEDHLLSPYFFFNLFITDELIEDIVFQTNLYAEQEFQKNTKKYNPTNTKEMKVFLGLNIFMRIKPLPSYRNYWSVDEDMHDNYISQFMPVNRFGWLLSHVHLNDNSVMPKKWDAGFDKLYKVRPFIDKIKENLKKYYNCTKNIAIDESIIKFKGRSTLKQYMPKKPIKRGYKIWTLADANAYLYDFDVYTGKSDVYVEHSLEEKILCNMGLENGKNLVPERVN